MYTGGMAKMGRPPKGINAKSKEIMIRVTPKEARLLRAEAKRLKISVAQMLMTPYREAGQ
jgi:hypothetical protein